MINDNIFNIFSFFNFYFEYFRSPVIWPNLKKIALKTRSRKYRKKSKKTKIGKNVIIYDM